MREARSGVLGRMLLRLLACLACLVSAACAAASPHADNAGARAGVPGVPTSPAPPAVTLTYLGVAGWELRSGGEALLFDPYLSRLDARPGATLSPDEATLARYLPLGRGDARAILVSHSHYDHLLDVPSLAKATGARVVGTESTLNVARAAGVAEGSLILAHGGETFDVGPFSVRPARALHSLTGQASDAIPRGVAWPMKTEAFAEGGTLQYLVGFAGRKVLFVGTANLVDSELSGFRPDVAIVAVGLRQKVPDYSCRMMRALREPPVVFPNHFDDFRRPLGLGPSLGEEDREDLARFAEEIRACSPATRVVVPVRFEPNAI